MRWQGTITGVEMVGHAWRLHHDRTTHSENPRERNVNMGVFRCRYISDPERQGTVANKLVGKTDEMKIS